MDKIPPELIGRAIQDSEFRRMLLSDPQAVAASTGYELDEDQIEALLALDPEQVEAAIEALTGDLDYSKYG